MQRKISSLQLFILLVSISFGAGLIEMPRKLASIAGEDMWLSALVGGVAMMVAVVIAVKLSEYFPQQTSIEYRCILLGPILGQVANGILILQLLLVSGVGLRLFSATLKLFLFDMTPIAIIAFSFLLLAAYAGQYGHDVHVRLQQFVFLVMPLLFGIIFLGLLAVDTRHYQPLLAKGLMPMIRGIGMTWLSYTGAELIIGFLYPLLSKQQNALKTSLLAVTAVTAIVTVMVLIVQGILGVDNTGHHIYSTILAYREVEIPQTFVERIDGYLIAFWIFNFFTSFASLLYYTGFGLGQMLRLETCRPVIWLLLPIVLLIALVPDRLLDFEVLLGFVNAVGMIWGLVISPGLLVLAWLRGKRRYLCG